MIMSRPKLPEGVPPDNQTKARLSADNADFYAPETAAPRFFVSNKLASKVSPEAASRNSAHARPFEDDDAAFSAHPSVSLSMRLWAYIVGAVILVLGLGAFFMAIAGDSLPLCANQPEWNQYNCRMR
jgi:hypothetical protein